jgi:hypothetical protein
MSDNFLKCLVPDICIGQQEFSNTLRRLVQLVRPDLYKILDFCDPEVFLEPFAFLCFSIGNHNSGLEQAFASYLASIQQPLKVEVFSDNSGRFYVPKLGYFTTNLYNEKLNLVVSSLSEEFYIEHKNKRVSYSFEAPMVVGNTTIDLCQHSTPLLDRCFVGSDNQIVSVEITCTKVQLSHVAKAFEIIQKVWPNLYENILNSVRLLVLFRSEKINSFSTTSAHGTVFLNTTLGDNEVFFLEDLTHQCGHVIFSAATVNADEYFAVPSATFIKVFNGKHTDNRSVYEALHGVFTEVLIANCLDMCVTDGIFLEKQHHELCGRLTFILKRFAVDIKNFTDRGILSTKGEKFVRTLYDIWLNIATRQTSLVVSTDISNQGYNFSYRKYAELNPIAIEQVDQHDLQSLP